MTRLEFVEVMGRIAVAIQKPLMSGMTLEVYFDLLNDLPIDALRAGAKRVLLEHQWSTFPTVAELRKASVESSCGTVAAMTAGEAWGLASKAVARIDMEIPHTVAKAMAGLPPLVVRAMQAYGLASLVHGKEPLGVVRAQFERIFSGLAEAEAKRALLPQSLVQAIEQQGRREPLAGPVAAAVQAIGKE